MVSKQKVLFVCTVNSCRSQIGEGLLNKMEANLEEKDKIKHKDDIQNNRDHLNSLKGKNSSEWREYATKCMIEILDNKV